MMQCCAVAAGPVFLAPARAVAGVAVVARFVVVAAAAL